VGARGVVVDRKKKGDGEALGGEMNDGGSGPSLKRSSFSKEKCLITKSEGSFLHGRRNVLQEKLE